jgi:hypothetical protein
MLPDVAGICKENTNKKTAVTQRGKISEIFTGKEYHVTLEVLSQISLHRMTTVIVTTDIFYC